MVTEQQLHEALQDALNSVLCFCGNHKRMNKPFCFQCYDLLPVFWQTAFRHQSASMYHTNLIHCYDAASEYLRKRRQL